jgi:hypothetical protein
MCPALAAETNQIVARLPKKSLKYELIVVQLEDSVATITKVPGFAAFPVGRLTAALFTGVKYSYTFAHGSH